MNRLELLYEMKNMANHNICCYSKDISTKKPKQEYVEEWHLEKEKLELINELIEEENSNDFAMKTTIYRIQNNRENRLQKDLALLLDRKNGLSCYLSLEEDENSAEYYCLTFSIHKKDEFDEIWENIDSIEINKKALKSRKALEKEMKKQLKKFQKYVETNPKLKNYYELEPCAEDYID